MSIQFLDMRVSQPNSYSLPYNTGPVVPITEPGTQVASIGVITKGVSQANQTDIRVVLRASIGLSCPSETVDYVTFRLFRIANGVTTLVFQGNQIVPSVPIIAGFTAADFHPTLPANGQLVYQAFVQATTANTVHLDGPVSFNGSAAAGTFS
ncbi:hypothetical protein [Marininema halotolerans]|uniref:Exosporium protein C n=1 Tax=Marininema halotolerans TaxID=1155944 RepID=A0A1I6TNG3_9BACL|nr:hypothetical protein [Marininema halotolerans]SFS90715.1 hypothetical protein SAMN05444972_110162 [Marininema halotolerans]